MSDIKRNSGVDLLKTLAVISVVIIHVASSGCFLPAGSADWIMSLFWGSLTRFAVPVFFMCSGCLLLDPGREITVKKLWSKNMVRIVAAMLLWAFLYKLFQLAVSGGISIGGITNAIKEVLLFNHEFHLYYLHITVLVYAFLPVTRLLTVKAEKRELEYFLAFWAVTGILLPTIMRYKPFCLIEGFPGQWPMNMSYAAIGYTVLGYYLKKYPLSKKKSLLAFATGFLLTFGLVVFLSLKCGYLYEHFWSGMTVNLMIMSVGVFGLFISAGVKSKAVTYISKASFTVYLCHVFFLKICESKGFVPGNLGNALVTIPLISALIFICSLAVYEVLRRIKFMKFFI